MKFTANSCYVQHSEVMFLFATISNSSYVLKVNNITEVDNTTAMTCIHEWYRKLSHRNIAHIKKLKETLKIKITNCDCSSECLACLKGKFPQKSVKPNEPRDVITTDVCGPFRTTSIGGSSYFVTFTCANTDYTEVAAIKSKSDCKIQLSHYIKRCLTQFGRYPKIIRSDRDSHLWMKNFKHFLIPTESFSALSLVALNKTASPNGKTERCLKQFARCS